MTQDRDLARQTAGRMLQGGEPSPQSMAVRAKLAGYIHDAALRKMAEHPGQTYDEAVLAVAIEHETRLVQEVHRVSERQAYGEMADPDSLHSRVRAQLELDGLRDPHDPRYLSEYRRQVSRFQNADRIARAERRFAERGGGVRHSQADLMAIQRRIDSYGRLTLAESAALSDSDFAYVAPDGGRHLPLHTREHVKTSVAAFGQQQFHAPGAKKDAALRLLAHARKHGLSIGPDTPLAQAARADVTPGRNP